METIKEEKKAEGIKIISVGQLMKSLMDKKWIPRGNKEIVRAVYDIRHKMIGLYEDDGKEYFELVSKKSLRELVSTDSGLWQFVCENGMIDNLCETRYWRNHFELDEIEYNQPDYQYWLIESSLKDESELEDFLLSNIKVEGNENINDMTTTMKKK